MSARSCANSGWRCGAPARTPFSLTMRRSRRGRIGSDVNRSRSKQLHERAVQLIPGGVNSPVRAMKSVGGEPVFMARGEGPYIFDVDGHRYIDYVCSWGPLILGHAPKAVVEAVTR